jgi:exosortase
MSTRVRPDLRSPILLHASWMLLLLLLVAPTLGFLWEKWTRNVWYNGHGIFVPVLVGFLAYHALRRSPVREEPGSAWGFALVVPGLLMIAVDSAIRTQLLAAVGLLVCLPGLALLLLGPARTRVLLFPCLLAFFMLPIPAGFKVVIHGFLRRFTAEQSANVLELLGQPALAEGTLLFLPHGTFRVVEECSGFSALYAAVTIALVLAYLSDSKLRRVVLLLAPWPLAMACNVARIVILALLAESQGFAILDTSVHVLSGYATFLATLALLFLLAEHGPRGAPG